MGHPRRNRHRAGAHHQQGFGRQQRVERFDMGLGDAHARRRRYRRRWRAGGVVGLVGTEGEDGIGHDGFL
ncbi:hypothetical protein GCM10011572_24320 [Pseudoduganella buxea]|uniref:Uncharacterized protein n=1 Tax=Pseudoduganella buxea TaxID=1949069 RepID=A0ABQ1KNK4_9BURK|nr:hypothetical protein GCM10011572_24320 [Pseudoduganella buxea]